MKRTITLLLFFVAVSISAQTTVPKISCQEMNYDFGNIFEGQIVNHEFIIENSGGGILKIQRVKASCGCTAAKPEKNELAAGEKTTINVKFNTARRKGSQKKYVYVFTNDTKTPEIRLSFTANILKTGSDEANALKAPELKLSLNHHDFGTVEEGRILELNIPFQNTGSEVLKISKVKTTCGCTAALLSSKNLKPGENGNLRIEYDTTDRVGKTTRSIIIHSNDPKSAQHVITIFANIEKRES